MASATLAGCCMAGQIPGQAPVGSQALSQPSNLSGPWMHVCWHLLSHGEALCNKLGTFDEFGFPQTSTHIKFSASVSRDLARNLLDNNPPERGILTLLDSTETVSHTSCSVAAAITAKTWPSNQDDNCPSTWRMSGAVARCPSRASLAAGGA